MAFHYRDDPPKKGASVRLGGVTVACSSILKREEELKALSICIPANSLSRKRSDNLIGPASPDPCTLQVSIADPS